MKITFLHKRDNGVAIEYGSDFWRTCLHDGIRYNEPENWTVACPPPRHYALGNGGLSGVRWR
jgi:hypothetical protein